MRKRFDTANRRSRLGQAAAPAREIVLLNLENQQIEKHPAPSRQCQMDLEARLDEGECHSNVSISQWNYMGVTMEEARALA